MEVLIDNHPPCKCCKDQWVWSSSDKYKIRCPLCYSYYDLEYRQGDSVFLDIDDSITTHNNIIAEICEKVKLVKQKSDDEERTRK